MEKGEAFKLTRKSRGITQNEISKKHLSRSTISKFENNKLNLSIENFEILLNSIDVSFEEFNFIKNNYSYSDKEKILYLFNNIFSNSDNLYIKKLISLCDNYLSNHFSKSIKNIKNTLYILDIMHSSPDYKSKVDVIELYAEEIWQDLSKVDSWTILDIKIINCCLHFFSSDIYIQISDQLMKSIKKYKNFSNITILETSIYLNLTLLFLLNKQKKEAKIFSKEALYKAKKSKRIDYISLSLIRYGLLFSKENRIDEGLFLLNFLEDDLLKEKVKQEIDFFKNMEFEKNN